MSWRSAGRPDAPPLVLADRVKNAMRLVALDEAASALGLKPGQGLAEARAMCPGLDVCDADPSADAAFLSGLADWCDRYTPLVALDGRDGLYLDISGCAHLFGGEKALLNDILSRLFHMGLDARAAISGCPGLSSAAARFGGKSLIEKGEEADVLTPLPVSALRLDSLTVSSLVRVGLKQIGDLIHVPRAPLARRFGQHVLLRLDQALGLDDEPISPRMPVASLSCERRLAEPVVAESDILLLTDALATALKPALEARDHGGRVFELLLFRVDGKVIRFSARASAPLRDPKRIAALFKERLARGRDEIDAGFGFEILRLSIHVSEPMEALQGNFAAQSNIKDALSGFIDTIAARFGHGSLQSLLLHQSHIPERASQFAPFEDSVSGKTDVEDAVNPDHIRPLRLFRNPEPVDAVADVPEGPPVTFRWRRALHRVVRAEGPERIAAEWWIDGEEALTRDYFRIEDEAGRRFWLFRQGLYGREMALPRWFMHGVFA